LRKPVLEANRGKLRTGLLEGRFSARKFKDNAGQHIRTSSGHFVCGALEEEVRKRYYERYATKDVESKKRAFNRALHSATNSETIVIEIIDGQKYIWQPDPNCGRNRHDHEMARKWLSICVLTVADHDRGYLGRGGLRRFSKRLVQRSIVPRVRMPRGSVFAHKAIVLQWIKRASSGASAH
jgi:hypothetical protein